MQHRKRKEKVEKKKRKAEVFELFPALQACSATSKFPTNTSEESEVQITIQDVSRQRHPILISLCTISFVLLSHFIMRDNDWQKINLLFRILVNYVVNRLFGEY